jgi:hypothetical protein
MATIRIMEPEGERDIDLATLSRAHLLSLKLTLTGRATGIKTALEECSAREERSAEAEAWAARAVRARRFMLANLRAIDSELAMRPKPPKPGSKIRHRPSALARFQEQNAPPDEARVTDAMALGPRDLAERFVKLEDRFGQQIEHGQRMAAERLEYSRMLRLATGALALLADDPTAREALACVASVCPTILYGIVTQAEAAE